LRKISVLVKPTHRCNLNCQYCYDKQYGIKEMMSLETLEKICKFLKGRCGSWIWHGGEPLMMPLEFYEEAYKILQKYQINQVSFQSNGVLLTEEIILKFKDFGWNMGFSFDGLTNEASRGSSEKLINNLLLYKKLYHEPGTIMVVDRTNVKGFHKNYQYFKDLGLPYFNFNRVFLSETAELLSEDMTDIYLEEFAKLFDLWINDPKPLQIRNFDNYLKYILGLETYLCSHRGECSKEWLGFNPLGDIYPCDRWFSNKYRYGNVDDFVDLDELYLKCESFKTVAKNEALRKKDCRNKCEIYEYCKGGCNANAIAVSGGVKQDELDCLLQKKELYHLYNKLKNLKVEEVKNPNLKKILMNAGYRDLIFIGDLWRKNDEKNIINS
jgi:uncharacterized protein